VTSSSIHIGKVSLPLETYAISGTALLGTKGAGKTYAAKGIAEQLLDRGVPIVVFDPIGRWRFMKIAGDDAKKSRGYKIVVAGGEQPDLPLTPASAPEIVRAAIRENIPLVIDLYDRRLSKADWRRIVQSCFRTLLYENKGVRHVFLEETAEFAPQKVLDGETYAEVEKLVRMGGNASVGITLINQRAQEVNKAVLDLCDNLVLMRQRGSHAIDALEKWIDKLDPDQAQAIARAMPHMKAGEAWVFTGAADTATHVHTAPIHSFHPDRSRPQLTAAAEAARRADPAEFVARLSGELEQLIEEQKANDPAVLKRKIAELERQAKTAAAGDADAAYKSGYDTGRQHGFGEGQQSAFRQFQALRQAAVEAIQAERDLVLDALRRLGAAGSTLPEWQSTRPKEGSATDRGSARTPVVQRAQQPNPTARAVRPPPIARRSNGDRQLGLVEQRVLDALAELEAMGASRPERELLAFMSGYSHVNSKGFATAVPDLKAAGLIDYQGGGRIALTAEGRAHAAAPSAPRTPEELQERVIGMLGGASGRVLKPLIDAYPKALAREELAQAAGYGHVNSKGFTEAIARLKSLDFIGYPDRGSIAAQPVLFLESR
jgi:uncharacterized protein